MQGWWEGWSRKLVPRAPGLPLPRRVACRPVLGRELEASLQKLRGAQSVIFSVRETKAQRQCHPPGLALVQRQLNL